MRRQLVVHENEHKLDRENKLHIVQRISTRRPLKNTKVEESRAEAREIIRQLGKKVITLNFGTDGNVHAHVWKDGPPEPPKVPGWSFKRPLQPRTKKQ